MYIEKTNRSGDYCAVAVTDVAKRNYPFPRYHSLLLNRAGQVCLFDYTSRDLNNQPTASSTNLQLSLSWTYFTRTKFTAASYHGAFLNPTVTLEGWDPVTAPSICSVFVNAEVSYYTGINFLDNKTYGSSYLCGHYSSLSSCVLDPREPRRHCQIYYHNNNKYHKKITTAICQRIIMGDV